LGPWSQRKHYSGGVRFCFGIVCYHLVADEHFDMADSFWLAHLGSDLG
jgi:hypothetical protein